jgi:hypothetical protein
VEASIISTDRVISLAMVLGVVLLMPPAPVLAIPTDITLLDESLRVGQIRDSQTPVGRSTALRGGNGTTFSISPTLQPFILLLPLGTSVDRMPGDTRYLLGNEVQESPDAMLAFSSLTLCRETYSAVSGTCVSGLRDDLWSSFRLLYRNYLRLSLYGLSGWRR